MKLNHPQCNLLFKDVDLQVKRWIISILTELSIAEEKHPDFPKNKVVAAAIVAEESGELIRAALRHDYEDGKYYEMHVEAIQTAAMCIRFLKNAPEKPFKED